MPATACRLALLAKRETQALHNAGPAAERSLVTHSILTFPNYIVIGLPVRPAALAVLPRRECVHS